MTGIKDLSFDFFTSLLKSDILANIVVSVLVVVIWFIIGLILVRIAKLIVKRLLNVKKTTPRSITITKLLSNVVRYVIWFTVILVILTELGVNIAPLLASAGVLGLAIGFGAQTIVRDFISGFFILMDNIFSIGDVIEVGGFKGEVREMGLRTTRIRNFKGEVKIINNGDLNNLINFSKTNSLAIVDFGVAYETDMSTINAIMEEFIESIGDKYPDIIERPSFLGVTELANSSINLRIIAKTNTNKHFQIERDLRRDIVIFLNSKDITIPFPQIVVHNA